MALVSADSDRYPDLRPWQGTVVLDSAALDLSWLEWRTARRRCSAARSAMIPPIGKADFACSRCIDPPSPPACLQTCAAARAHGSAGVRYLASSFGTEVRAAASLTHRQINVTLGRPGDYTDAVDAFLRVAWAPAAPAVALFRARPVAQGCSLEIGA